MGRGKKGKEIPGRQSVLSNAYKAVIEEEIQSSHFCRRKKEARIEASEISGVCILEALYAMRETVTSIL